MSDMDYIKVTFLVLSCSIAVFCQEDTVNGTCSNAIVVMTKEEMKTEIRSQIADALKLTNTNNSTSQCCSSVSDASANDVVKTLEKISNNLDLVANKLMKLHQPGMTASHPATSCKEIYDFNPNTTSGYYWLEDSDDTAVRMYCNMSLTCKGVGGGWMQVIKLDMTNSSNSCPSGFRFKSIQSKRLCGKSSNLAGCSSTSVAVQGIKYGSVCGKITAYQHGSPDSFKTSAASVRTINGNYVDGISLTHGSPRQHIWTFAGAPDELASTVAYSCPCTNIHHSASATRPPSFVGTDYFCDTAFTGAWQRRLHINDPLWDGAGCGPANTCCSLNNPPWFLKQLPSATADNIDLRLCLDEASSNKDILIEKIELFVQ